MLNAGIIDEHIQAAECFLRERDHLSISFGSLMSAGE